MRYSLLTASVVSLSLSACERGEPAIPAVKVVQQQPVGAAAEPEPQTDKSARLTWDDLKLPHDDRFEPGDLPMSAEKVKDRRVRITGVMHGGVPRRRGNSEFVIMRNRSGRFGPGYPIDELMKVTLTSGRTVSYLDDDIQVDGILRIDPVKGEDGSIWCVYHVDDARVYQSGKVVDEPTAKLKPDQQ